VKFYRFLKKYYPSIEWCFASEYSNWYVAMTQYYLVYYERNALDCTYVRPKETLGKKFRDLIRDA
jgi:hypothetical protein